MKIHRSSGHIHIDLTGPEASVLLEELETVPGGSKMPKLRQVCKELSMSLGLPALIARPGPPKPRYPKRSPSPEVSAAATALGRLGGLKGGDARAASLSPRERSEIARKAAEARWGLK